MFHYGRRPWHAPIHLADLVDFGDLDPARVFVATHQPGLRILLSRVLEPTTPTTIMNALQKWLIKERTEGLAQGRAEGRAEGQTAARVDLLHRQLTRRFGPLPAWVAERLAAASPARLEALCDRVLDAPTLDAVFAD